MADVYGYTICSGYIVLDENNEFVDWFDTEEEADEYLRELEEDND